MRLFEVKREMDAAFGFETGRQLLRADVSFADGAGDEGAASGESHVRLVPGEVYFAGFFEWQTLFLRLARIGESSALRFLSPTETAAALDAPGMPARLGWSRKEPFVPLEAQLRALRGDGAPARIAVINLFHTAFGDAILCATMLRELRARLEERLGAVRLELFQNAYHPEVHRMYAAAPDVDAIHPLPAPLTQLAGFDGWIDLTNEPIPPGRPWIDASLEAVAIDPASVPPARKRNRLTVSSTAERRLAPVVRAAKAGGAPVLLFHPAASTAIRSIPPARVPAIIDAILSQTGWTVASAVPIDFHHPRFVDWSAHSRNFDDFVCLAAHADRVLSVDTSLYHVADAFSVPGTVLFTSIDPAERIGSYPYLAGIRVGDPGALAGLHRSEQPSDVALADALWDTLDIPEVIAAIEEMARRRDAHESRDARRGRGGERAPAAVR